MLVTNAIIERRGAALGLLTTKGFRDILHIGRHKRPYNFSLHFDVPWQSQPLVKRRNRIAVAERILPPTGDIVTPLDEAAARLKMEINSKPEEIDELDAREDPQQLAAHQPESGVVEVAVVGDETDNALTRLFKDPSIGSLLSSQ